MFSPIIIKCSWPNWNNAQKNCEKKSTSALVFSERTKWRTDGKTKKRRKKLSDAAHSLEHIFPGTSHLFKHCFFSLIRWFSHFTLISTLSTHIISGHFVHTIIKAAHFLRSMMLLSLSYRPTQFQFLYNTHFFQLSFHTIFSTSFSSSLRATFILFMFGLSLLNVSNRNNINVNFSWFQ